MTRGFTNKHCPKCNGNIFIDQDCRISEEGYHGWYEWCLQCGYRRYLNPVTILLDELEIIPVMKEPVIA